VAQRGLDHQSSPPARQRRKRGASFNAIGRSRGGPSTKVHLIVDALGLPIDYEITEGQRYDSVASVALVERVDPSTLLGDKAFDTNPFRAVLDRIGCTPVIPPMGNRARDFPYDAELYKARSQIECTFNLLKQARRFATRYEKTLRNYAAVVTIGCALLWLRI
jgi:transposase